MMGISAQDSPNGWGRCASGEIKPLFAPFFAPLQQKEWEVGGRGTALRNLQPPTEVRPLPTHQRPWGGREVWEPWWDVPKNP